MDIMSTSVDAQAHLKAMFNQNLFIKMQDFKSGLFSCYRVLASCTIYLCIGEATALETLCECAGWPEPSLLAYASRFFFFKIIFFEKNR